MELISNKTDTLRRPNDKAPYVPIERESNKSEWINRNESVTCKGRKENSGVMKLCLKLPLFGIQSVGNQVHFKRQRRQQEKLKGRRNYGKYMTWKYYRLNLFYAGRSSQWTTEVTKKVIKSQTIHWYPDSSKNGDIDQRPEWDCSEISTPTATRRQQMTTKMMIIIYDNNNMVDKLSSTTWAQVLCGKSS